MSPETTTAAAALERVVPIAVFLLAISVVAELSDRFGVFDVAGHWLARRGRHRVWLLWLLFALFSASCTIVPSLDTTAVLLPPVGLANRRPDRPAARPFAPTTLWIADTGSLLLVVSNRTNLLELDRFEHLGLDNVGTGVAAARGHPCHAGPHRRPARSHARPQLCYRPASSAT